MTPEQKVDEFCNKLILQIRDHENNYDRIYIDDIFELPESKYATFNQIRILIQFNQEMANDVFGDCKYYFDKVRIIPFLTNKRNVYLYRRLLDLYVLKDKKGYIDNLNELDIMEDDDMFRHLITFYCMDDKEKRKESLFTLVENNIDHDTYDPETDNDWLDCLNEEDLKKYYISLYLTSKKYPINSFNDKWIMVGKIMYEMQEKINELELMPEGPKYKEAKENFENKQHDLELKN
jgi:hypothetical protein